MSIMADPLIHIVEDDKEFGSYLMELLEDEGYKRFQWMMNGIEAVNAILKEIPQLVILDLNLPGLRGEEICRLIRSSRLHQNTRILICSEMPQAKQRELELLRIGADRYVAKPFQEELFIQDVKRLLAIPPNATPLEPPDAAHYLEETRALDDVDSEPKRGAKSNAALVTSRFEGYQLLNVIGGGAMGTVYRAFQERLDRMVALKVFLKNENHGEEELLRFKREARLMANLNHPNIITVYDFGQTGYTYYISMELMARGSVYDRLFQGEMTLEFAIQFIREVFPALHHLHEQNILHRDMKPGNVLVSKTGTLKLGDFGISSHFNQKETGESSSDYILGTKPYMAPELLQGEKATPLTDLYALGRTLLRLFEGEQAMRTITPLSLIRPDLPNSFSLAIARCMTPDPRQRYQSVESARVALLKALGEDPN
jgi:CheY-like chemotaxis protein